ncbi:gluconokinase [Maribacter sp. CXY002]|uniref:gluconokinase n=1 Tax=Maribacter luteocoastalis TaxID=3407671 RepID=UPI003B66E32D
MNKPYIVYVMGVSGSGKSTVGKLLAEALGFPFFDGDDYHPPANIAKMSSGKPLDDSDRKGWLESLNRLALANRHNGAVIICSALKEAYRALLTKNLEGNYQFVFLDGTMDEISERLAQRSGHFMPKDLLQSQFNTLERPKNAITVSIKHTPTKIVDIILDSI